MDHSALVMLSHPVLQLPHAAEEVSCKSSIPLKVEAMDKRMYLHHLLQSARYQRCFQELANLLCREEMDRGRVFGSRAMSSNLPASENSSIYYVS